MGRSTAELEAMLRSRICQVCSDRTVEGTCSLPAENCSLFYLFPQVAEAIGSTHSNDINDYVRAIRAKVCTACRQQAGDGSCETRQEVRCALDAYLLLVVDAIEEATGKSFDRGGLNAAQLVPAPGPARQSSL